MDLYFQGTACWHKGVSPENLTRARGFFERALALNSDNVEALLGMAWVDFCAAGAFMSDDRARRLAAIEAILTKTLSLAPNHAFAQFMLGAVHIAGGRDAAQGIQHCERALAFDRNLAVAHGYIGLGKFFDGRGEDTEAHVREALRLSPRDTTANFWMAFAGIAKIGQGADEEAVEWLRRSIEANRNAPIVHFNLASALAHLGRMADAREAVAAGLALDPNFTIARYRTVQYANSIYLAQRDRIAEGYRKAGVPEK